MNWRGVTLAVSGGLLSSCNDPGGKCEGAFQTKDYPTAASSCEKAFARSGDARFARLAAGAHFSLGHDDAVLVLADRVRGDPKAGEALIHAGRVLQKRGQAEKARATFAESYRLFEAKKDHEGAFRAALNVEKSYWRNSEYREALSWAQVAHREARAAGEDRLIGQALIAIFSILYEIGDPDAASAFLAEAQKLGQPKAAEDRAVLAFKQGLLHYAQQHKPLAIAAYQEALALTVEANIPELHWITQLNLLEIALEEGRLDQAEKHLGLAKAELAATGSQNNNSHVGLHYYAARLARAQGRLDVAETEIDSASRRSPIPDWRWRLEQEAATVAELRGEPRKAEAGYLQAIDAVESMRKAVQLDDLKAWLLASKREPFEKLFTLRARSGKELAALEIAELARSRTFLDAFVSGGISPKPTGPLEPKAAIERADALSALLPALRASPVVAHRPIEQTIEDLHGVDALAYFEAGGGLWLAKMSGGKVQLQLLSPPLRDLRRRVDDFLQNIDSAENGEALGQLLLPDNARPPPGTNVYLVSSESVSRLPFGALRRRGRYWVQDYVLRYVPSLTALGAIRGAPPSSGPGLVIGDPNSDLPAARAEAEDAARSSRATLALGRAATRERLRASSQASLFHFAAHSGVGPAGAYLSMADGAVSANEILAWGLRSRLVVLSSCASSASRAPELWGSLSGSFLAAGSRSVVATLWSVEDRASRQLLSLFYASNGVKNPALALALAQRALLQSGRPATEWASFVALGD